MGSAPLAIRGRIGEGEEYAPRDRPCGSIAGDRHRRATGYRRQYRRLPHQSVCARLDEPDGAGDGIPGCRIDHADVDQDGAVNNGDVSSFVGLRTGK